MGLVRPQQIQPKIPEIGRIYKGDRKTDPKRPGTDLDHFRFEPNERLIHFGAIDKSHSSLFAELKSRYEELGEKPRTIRIRFPYTDIEDNFSSVNEVWAKVKGMERCTRRCDGQTVKLHTVESTSNGQPTVALSRSPVPCAADPNMQRCPAGCKPTGMLKFMMPDLKYPGLIILTTHSIHDILEIQGNLEVYRGWDLSKIPFKLCRTEKTIKRTDESGNIYPMKKWLCHIEIDPEFGVLLQESRSQQYMNSLTNGLSLPSDCVYPDDTESTLLLKSADPDPLTNKERIRKMASDSGVTTTKVGQIARSLFGDNVKSESLTPDQINLLESEVSKLSVNC